MAARAGTKVLVIRDAEHVYFSRLTLNRYLSKALRNGFDSASSSSAASVILNDGGWHANIQIYSYLKFSVLFAF
jgi:hypothetical protein